MKAARVEALPSEERINAAINISAASVFGGVSAALWLFAHWKERQAPLSWDGLKRDITDRQKGLGAFRHLVEGLPGLEGPQVPFGHKIVLRSVPRTGDLIAYVEILGVLRIGGVYGKARGPTPLIEHLYVYDLDVQCDRTTEFRIDQSVFESRDWSIEGLAPSDHDAVKNHYEKAIREVWEPRYRGPSDSADSPCDEV